MKKLPSDFAFLRDMYADGYYPTQLVDRVRETIQKVVVFIEAGGHSKEEIQTQLDAMTETINDLQEDFDEAGSELETVARESIGETVDEILKHFEIDIDVETAIRKRDW